MSLVIDQPYQAYTPQDHAIWRYVMRQNVHYLSQVAHGSYVEGLKKTGISIDRIPHMYGMNRILKEIGWAAVAVDGFIPPSAFMEFQAYNVLVIAADIRPFNQIAYTPAPDIIHEAAGHAPIIADPEYAGYLREFGRFGSKAFSSAKDYELYEAIRHLSILKADPYTPKPSIETALEKLKHLENNMGDPSEMAKIRNLHWWTVEYGLIGDLHNPKIYGAGLLSSIGESYRALQPEVRKLPYTLEAAQVGFDITTMQPQLFVTPDFQSLMHVLLDFSRSMAQYRGGLYAALQAVDSANTATLVFSSGLELSGTIDVVIPFEGEVAYIQASGNCMFSLNGKAIDGEGPDHYPMGMASPIGRPHGAGKPLESMSLSELRAFGLENGEYTSLTWPSGILMEGRVDRIVMHQGIPLLIHWREARISYAGRVLWGRNQGHVTQVIGDSIRSAYPGPADPQAFGLTYKVPEEKTHKIQYAEKDLKLHSIYQNIRDLRENSASVSAAEIWALLSMNFADEWLASLELLEIIRKQDGNPDLALSIEAHLKSLLGKDEELNTLINNGLNLI